MRGASRHRHPTERGVEAPMHDETTKEAPPRAGRREWIGLAVLALPTLLVALDIGVLFLAVPHLSADLGTSSVEQLWIADVYGFFLAGFLITMGTLGDRVGRRRLLLVGGAAFGLASVLAAYSGSPGMLIVARAVLGVAGATLMPSTLALISNMFADARQRGLAISLWAACQFGGAALGPVVGGVLLERFWWGSVFLLGVPVMALLLVLAPPLLPEYRNPQAGRLDLVSVALSLATVLPLVYGVKELAVGDGTAPAVPLAALAVGLLLGFLFVRRQLRLEHPLLDLRLFAERSFGVVLVTMLLGGATIAGTGLLVSQYLQSVLGLSPAMAALWYAPMGLALAVGAMLSPALVRWMKPGTAIAGGLALSAVGFALVALTDAGGAGGLALAVLGIAVLALGDGPLVSLGTGLVVGSVPPERAGSAASISETSLHFGGTLGMALMGTIGAAVYRSHVAGALPPGLDKQAGETLAGAVSVASELPAEPAARLLTVAREAFTAGLNTVGVIGVVVFVGLAALTAATLRRPAPAKTPVPAKN
ncbi:MFS transporter [Streptosporangium saharense]|uniref:MFS transporter n=1 Tax=Streptosporangium saharense TaxID=1706840 RepID=UPI00369593C9